jgi:ABC-type Mn2+/Zn2+ transport system permease subunit
MAIISFRRRSPPPVSVWLKSIGGDPKSRRTWSVCSPLFREALRPVAQRWTARLTVDGPTVLLTAVGLAVVLVLHALFAKEFQFVSFDADTAAAMGYRARMWDLLLYATIGLSIAFSIHTVGVLLAFSALVLPPVTALLLTRRMKSAFSVSVLLGLVPVPIGLYLSFVGDLPSSATIVAVMFVVLLLGGLVSRVHAAR